MKLFILLNFLYFSSAFSVSVLEVDGETNPIPAGIETSDDPAIFYNSKNPEKSLILGVSKNKIKYGGKAGLGVYNLEGKELNYIVHDRLNNVDLRQNVLLNNKYYNLAIGSNRDKKAISLFSIISYPPYIELIDDLKLNVKGKKLREEPYGICSYHNEGEFHAFLPMKNGKIYQFLIINNDNKFSAEFVDVIDFRKHVSRKVDELIIDTTVKDVVYETRLDKNELIEELNDALKDRFQLEGCVADDENKKLYFGVEQLGVVSYDITKKKMKLLFQVKKSKSSPDATVFLNGEPRYTNDIEGLSLIDINNEKHILVSVQGISEYAVLEANSGTYKGSFKLKMKNDEITETDGLDILQMPLGSSMPHGLLVVHDHHNLDQDGNIENGNYKFISLEKVLNLFK